MSKIIRISDHLSLKITFDSYWTEKTGMKNHKLAITQDGFQLSKPTALEFARVVRDLGGVVFTEYLCNWYEVSKLIQVVGFQFTCSSMSWICDRTYQSREIPSNCRIVGAELIPRYEKRVREIAGAFDTSYYAQYDLYRPHLSQMYQDKTLKHWRENGEIILWFDGEAPVGFTTYFKGEGRITMSCVDPNYRGRNVFYEMTALGVQTILRDPKKEIVDFDCLSSSIGVQRVWHRLGFKPSYSTVVFAYGLDKGTFA